MSGFRKCGIYPLNPGEISDHQLASSHAFMKPKPASELDGVPPEQEKLYQKRYEEGFDLDDPKYSQWLKAKGLHASAKHNEKTLSESTQGSSTASVVSTCAPDSYRASLTVSSSVSTTSDVLDDVLTLPQPKTTKKKRKPGFNQKAVCITDDKVLQELEEKKEEKEQKKDEMIAKQIEREKRRNINRLKEKKRRNKNRLKEKKGRNKKTGSCKQREERRTKEDKK